MYAVDPAAWCAKYLYGAKFTFSPAARGGTLIETAIVQALTGRDIDDAINEAVAEYNKATIFDKSDKVTKWKDAMPDMIRAGFNEITPYGVPVFEADGGQKKVLIDCNMGDYKVPVLGFLDLYFPDKKVIIDIKTTMRMPSEMSKEHYRQASIYKAAYPDCAVRFFYITPKKTQWFDIEDVQGALQETKEIVKRMNAMLGIKKDTIKQIVPVIDSYYWTDEPHLRKEIFGF
jgi:hypothetical protein